MKITVFNGSPRGQNSNTHIMVSSFVDGAIKAGAKVENIFLIDKHIESCKGCFSCWMKTPGNCIIDDDVKSLLKKFIESDIVVLAFPLYIDSMPGILKLFMDRLIPLIDPHVEKDPQGECRHRKRYEQYPKLVIISNSGFPERSQFQVLDLYFQRVARNMHSEVLAEIYLPGGPILQVDMIIVKPLIAKYKKLLQKAGKQLVEDQCLTDKILEKLQRPIVPPDRYIDGMNKRFDNI